MSKVKIQEIVILLQVSCVPKCIAQSCITMIELNIGKPNFKETVGSVIQSVTNSHPKKIWLDHFKEKCALLDYDDLGELTASSSNPKPATTSKNKKKKSSANSSETSEVNATPANPFWIPSLKKYDVIKTNKINFGNNPVPHWAVVYKVVDGLAYCLTITSKEKYGKLKIEKSRMFSQRGYFVPTFAIIPEDIALKHFEFVYDAKAEFDRMVKIVKNII